MHILEHLFLVGEFPARAHLLSGLTLEQVTLCPDGASHSIYEELWHVVAYQQSIIAAGDPAGVTLSDQLFVERGSVAVHALQPKAIIKISPPRNTFALVEDAPASLLIAGGIGVTPIVAMASRLAALGRHIRIVPLVADPEIERHPAADRPGGPRPRRTYRRATRRGSTTSSTR